MQASLAPQSPDSLIKMSEHSYEGNKCNKQIVQDICLCSTVLVPLAKNDRDWLDQGLQSKSLDLCQGFGDLTYKLHEWSLLQLDIEQGLGVRKNIAEAKLVSPICSASGIGSINLLGFLIMDRNICRSQIYVHYTQVLSSGGKQIIPLCINTKEFDRKCHFKHLPRITAEHTGTLFLHSDSSFHLLDKSLSRFC